MSIKAQLDIDSKTLTISISGRFDVTSYSDFSASYKDQLTNLTNIVLDMGAVEYIDSSALGMMLMLRERAGGIDSNITIINISSDLRQILDMANFSKLFALK